MWPFRGEKKPELTPYPPFYAGRMCGWLAEEILEKVLGNPAGRTHFIVGDVFAFTLEDRYGHAHRYEYVIDRMRGT